MATEVGTAFVRIIPTARGIGREIQSVLNREVSGAGREAGREISQELQEQVADTGTGAGREIERDLQQAVDGAGTEAGREIERELERELDDTGRQIGEEVGREVAEGAEAGVRQIEGPAGDAGAQAGQAAGSRFGTALKAGVAAAAVAAGALLVKGFSDWLEQGRITSRLQAQLGETPEQAQRYGRIAGQLYAEAITADFQGAADAIQATMRAGLLPPEATDAQIKQMSTSISDLATLMEEDVGQTARAVGKMIRTGLAEDGAQALDILTRGVQLGGNEAGDLLDTFSEYSTQFRSMGLSGEQAMGLIAQGLKGGARDADVVADTIKEFSIEAVAGAERVVGGFESLGLNADEMVAKLAAGGPEAAEALDLVFDELRGIEDEATRNAIAIELFGTKAEDMAAALLSMDPSSAVKALGEVGGAAQEMGDTLRDNAAHRVEAFKRTLEQDLVTFVGGTLIPVLSDLKSRVAAAFKGAGIDKASLASGIRAWWAGGKGELGGAVTELKSMVATATQAIRDIWAQWGGEITAAYREHWSSLVQILKGAFQIIKGLFDVFAGLLTGDWSRMWEGVKSIGKGAWNAIVGLIRNSWNILHRVLKTGFTIAKNLVTSAWRFITERTGAAWRWVKDKIAEMMRRGYEAVRDRARGIRDRIVAIKDWVVGAFKGAGTWLLSAGLNIVRGLWNGIQAMGGWLKSQVVGWAKSVLPGPIEDLLGISSPSKYMRDQIGRQVAAGLALGIRDGLGGIRDAAGMAADAAVPGLPAHAAMTPAGAGAAAAPPQLVIRPDGTQMSRLLVQMIQLAVDTQLGGNVQRLSGRRG
ncbi:phage tail tape measure protein [Streptomyces aidingensis]|uniref:Phage-related minor tail protein n=1 Tax=Streptomyces aidingensis TaxID=910347 RepID=A0A1I1PX67_9ACTN|nr:phage tail tape measure protein [Streptomyces aidingensis]SFD14486.1 Phage-related minor tail protein [Streptomyces aidingensis]